MKQQKPLVKECCNMLENLGDLSPRVTKMFNFFDEHMSLPYVFLDSAAVLGSKILEKLKTAILEINQMFENYVLLREDLLTLFQKVKSSFRRKTSSLRENSGGSRLSGDLAEDAMLLF